MEMRTRLEEIDEMLSETNMLFESLLDKAMIRRDAFGEAMLLKDKIVRLEVEKAISANDRLSRGQTFRGESARPHTV